MSRSNINVRELRKEFQQLPEKPLNFLMSDAKKYGHPKLFDSLLKDNLDEFSREFNQLSERQQKSLMRRFCAYGLKSFVIFSVLQNVYSGMQTAALYGQLETLKILHDTWNGLLEKGDYRLRTEFEKEKIMSLKVACEKGHLEIVQFLIEKGRLDVNVVISDYYSSPSTPLIEACVNNHLNIVSYLLEKGANVSNYCLEKAVCNFYQDILVALLCHIEEEQLNARHLIILAKDFHNTDALKIFIQKFSNKIYIDFLKLIRSATIYDCLPTVQWLLEDGYVRSDDKTIDKLAQLADYHNSHDVALFLENRYNAENYCKLSAYALEHGPDWSNWE